jgi:hypothetical protein
VKRANTFFPITPAASPAPAADKATRNETRSGLKEEMGEEYAAAVANAEPALSAKPEATLASAAGAVKSTVAEAKGTNDADEVVTAVNRGSEPAAAAARKPQKQPNLAAILGVSWAIGLVLLAAQWAVLRGGRG